MHMAGYAMSLWPWCRLDLSSARCVSSSRPWPRVQVPLLLKLGEHERALTKAISAGDPDLVYLALFALQRSHSLPEAAVQAAIASRPLARSLYRAYCAQTARIAPSINFCNGSALVCPV